MNCSLNHLNINSPFSRPAFLSQSSHHGKAGAEVTPPVLPCEGFPLILDVKPQRVSIEFQAVKAEKQLERYSAGDAVAPSQNHFIGFGTAA